MKDSERVSLALRVEALRIAVETLFEKLPSGQTAKEAFIARLDELAAEAGSMSDPERQSQLQVESRSWRIGR